MTPSRSSFIARMRALWKGYAPRLHLHRRIGLGKPLDPSRADERRQRQIADGRLTASNGLVTQ